MKIRRNVFLNSRLDAECGVSAVPLSQKADRALNDSR